MNWLDIVILAAGGLVAVIGLGIGGLHIASMAAGSLVGIALSSRFHDRISPVFSRFTDSENGAEVAAFVAIFVVVLVASVFAGTVVRGVFQKLTLGWVDKVVGMGLGVVITFAVGSAALSTIQSYPTLGMEETIADSTIGSFLADEFDVVLRGLRFIPDDLGV